MNVSKTPFNREQVKANVLKATGVLYFPNVSNHSAGSLEVFIDARADTGQRMRFLRSLKSSLGHSLIATLSRLVMGLHEDYFVTIRVDFPQLRRWVQLSIGGKVYSSSTSADWQLTPRTDDADIDADDHPKCMRCQSSLAAYRIGGEQRCIRCMVRYAPLLRRSIWIALVVGTFLVVINQGGLILKGAFIADLLWKIPLTYTVPFCVATWSALSNARMT